MLNVIFATHSLAAASKKCEHHKIKRADQQRKGVLTMKTFPSKIDLWAGLIFTLTIALCLLPFVFALQTKEVGPILGSLPALIFGVALPLWLLKGTYYTFADTLLIVRSGPFKWQIPVKEITAVTPTSSVFSSPALSFDRLRIDYGRGQTVMISPKLKEEFLRELDARRAG
jgi:hypothetical protein